MSLDYCCWRGCGVRPAGVARRSGERPTPELAAVDQASAADSATCGCRSSASTGFKQRIAAKRGKVVVMDAWSTSCPPCMKEFHNLVELHKQYGPGTVWPASR